MIYSLLIVITLLSLVISEEIDGVTFLQAKAWQSKSSNPVQSDFPEVPYLSSRPNTAIGFTGGGARAYLAAMGQLAALTELGLADNIRYIGGISGGGWASTVYAYAQGVTDQSEFLGPIVQPQDIKHSDLKEMNANCARGSAKADMSALAIKYYLIDKMHIADAWKNAVQSCYLDPFGIKSNTRYSWSQDTVNDIKSRNPSLADVEFLLPTNPQRPYWIVGSSLVGPSKGAPYSIDSQNYTMLEFTPLYTGQFKNNDVDYQYKKEIRTKRMGGAIESFAFGGKAAPVGLGANVISVGEDGAILKGIPAPANYNDLGLAAGATSYAPGALFESAGITPKLANYAGYNMDYWSPTEKIPISDDTLFADGGSYENVPLINFIQRRVTKIVLFINAGTPMQPASSWNVETDAPDANQITDALSAFWGVLPVDKYKWQDRSYEYEKDQVFASSDWVPVVQKLQAVQAAGGGIVASFNLTTIANEWWGIPAGIEQQVTIVYLGRVTKWEDQLSKTMQELCVPHNPENIADTISHGPFRHFPNYGTTGGGVNYERANLLADLTGYTVLNNAATFQQIFS